MQRDSLQAYGAFWIDKAAPWLSGSTAVPTAATESAGISMNLPHHCPCCLPASLHSRSLVRVIIIFFPLSCLVMAWKQWILGGPWGGWVVGVS